MESCYQNLSIRDERIKVFTHVYTYILEDVRLNAKEKLTYILLNKFAEEKKHIISNETLATYVNCSLEEIENCLDVLERKGYIKIERREFKTNIFRLLDLFKKQVRK